MKKTNYNPTMEEFLECKNKLSKKHVSMCVVLKDGKFSKKPTEIYNVKHGDIFKYFMFNGTEWVQNPMALPFIATGDPYINAYGKPVVECRYAPMDKYKSLLKKEK